MQPNKNTNFNPKNTNPGASSLGQDAAINLMRQQIDNVYDDVQPNEKIAQAQQQTQAQSSNDNNPYERVQSNQKDIAALNNNPKANDEYFKKYHSAWQQYYQMYYERYYQHQQQQTPAKTSAAKDIEPESITQDQAVSEIRSELIQKIKTQAEKAKKSRHFKPALAALVVAIMFIFLQYNQLFIAQVKAFVSPGISETGSIIVDPSANVKVGPESKLIIPKINVDAPFITDIASLQEPYIQSKLKDGVVHYPIAGANAMPGQIGNTILMGHSSNDVFDDGKYKFVFVQLDRLEKGDVFYVNYNSTRYTYSVVDKKVIEPNQVNELTKLSEGKPVATLLTCTPPGTAFKRLLVVGEQIGPNPNDAKKPEPQPEVKNDTKAIGGNAPNFFERLFGGAH